MPSRLNDLGIRWQYLAENARAYAIANNDIGGAISELAKVIGRLDIEELLS